MGTPMYQGINDVFSKEPGNETKILKTVADEFMTMHPFPDVDIISFGGILCKVLNKNKDIKEFVYDQCENNELVFLRLLNPLMKVILPADKSKREELQQKKREISLALKNNNEASLGENMKVVPPTNFLSIANYLF